MSLLYLSIYSIMVSCLVISLTHAVPKKIAKTYLQRYCDSMNFTPQISAKLNSNCLVLNYKTSQDLLWNHSWITETNKYNNICYLDRSVFHNETCAINSLKQLAVPNKSLKYFYVNRYLKRLNTKYRTNTSNLHAWQKCLHLNGHHFKLAAVHSPPAVTHITNNCSSNDCFQGMFADIWHELSQDMNFTYTVYNTNHTGILTNKGWNGMIGMLERGEIDIAVADLTITKNRSAVVDFLPSILEVEEWLFLKTPDDSVYKDAYIKPFCLRSWLVIASMIFIFPLILAGIVVYSQENYRLYQCYGFVIQSLTGSASMRMPGSNCNRIAFVSVLFGGTLVYYSWEAKIISFLAVRNSYIPIETLNDLVENSQYRLIVAQGNVHLDDFRFSDDSLDKKIWEQKIKPQLNDLPSYLDMPNIILNDSYSVMYGESGLKHGKAYRNCKIIDTGIPIRMSQIAWALQKNSPFYPVLNYHIKRLKEIGVVRRYYKKYEIPKQSCIDYNGKPLTIKQCTIPFIILVVGILGCMAAFLVEMSSPHKKMMDSRKLGSTTLKKILTKAKTEVE